MNDASPPSSSPYSYSNPGTPKSPSGVLNVSRPTGLKLVLPPLKAGKPIKGIKRSAVGYGPSFVHEPEVKKAPRPVKLKPLREVLTRLVNLIKKKDDYAFFLTPVDASQVVGYADVVKRPMDFGTMSTKVSKGKYRSLEEFASDFRLVTGNAKIFNPPGTIYHAEADRIELFGLDHISKAASTVIEYETDWNIEIEQDDDTPTHNNGTGDEYDEDAPTPMDVDRRSLTAASPAPSVQQGQVKRGARGPYKKTQGALVADGIDVDGRMPGSRDGVGAFPPGSDWAKVMLALKLKGKRYRTKKERIRMEKAGLPYCTDGSLDYSEMEDPFSILSILVPEPLSRPHLVPLYPTSDSTASTPLSADPVFPAATTIPTPPYPPPPSLPSTSSQLPTATPTVSDHPKRRHWTILRNAPMRAHKGTNKDKDGGDGEDDAEVARAAHATDFGAFAGLAGGWAARGAGMRAEEGVFARIREEVCEDGDVGGGVSASNMEGGAGGYWSKARAMEAQGYIRDVVYGGPDGLAYVRSLEEFVRCPQPSVSVKQEDGAAPKSRPLGMPLTAYIENCIVDPLTDGLHDVLRTTAHHLSLSLSPLPPSAPAPPLPAPIRAQLALALSTYPQTHAALTALRHPPAAPPIDMAALIRLPAELFLSENEWAGARWSRERGAAGAEEGPEMLQHVLDHAADLVLELDARRALLKDADADTDADAHEHEHGHKNENGCAMEVDTDTHTLDAKEAHAQDCECGKEGGQTAEEKGEDEDEDALVRALRLNLLALAKRAPLDKIARLPPELVPEHVRRFVPTLPVPVPPAS